MSSKTIVCAACNAAVPYGRLSCPSCGELLASVAGAARPMVAAAVAMRSAPVSGAHRATPAVLVDVPSAGATGWDTPEPNEDWGEDEDFEEPLTARVEPAPSEPDTADARDLADAEAPKLEAPDLEAPDLEAPELEAPELQATADDEPQWPESRPATPSAVAVASPYAAEAPGAYVPPVVAATPAGPPALARAWAGHAIADEATASADTGARASTASLVDGARLPEFIGWLAVAGSAMAAVGFMLPWGISVIGAAGVDYFDRWGLAGPFHPLVAVALLGVLALALVRNPIPLWIRVGLPGLGLGALLLGLIWPYLLGLPGMGPGVLVVAVGAIMLAVAGIAALSMDRHAAEHRAV